MWAISSRSPRASRHNKMELSMRRSRWLNWALFLAGWSLVGLFFTIQELLTYPPEKPALPWTRHVSSEMGFWYAWGLLSIVIWRLAMRYPIQPGRLAPGLLLHVPAAAFFAVLQPFLQMFVVWFLRLFSEPLMTIVN